MAYLLADTREKHSGSNKKHSDPIDFIESKISENNKKYAFLPQKNGGGTIRYVMKKINTGDYAIILPGNCEKSKNTIAVVFERKTWQDLAGSIKDNRIIQQHKNLERIREETGCRVYYLIEGTPRGDETKIGRIPFKNLLAKVIHNSLRGIHFIQTKNAENTAEFLVKITRSVIKMASTGDIKFGRAEQTFSSELSGLIEKYKQQLQPNIIEKLSEINKLLRNVTSLPETKSPNSEIKQDQTDSEIEQTPKFEIKQNQMHIPEELNEKPIKKDSDIILKMFMQLPGIGSTVGPIIMQNYTLRNIISLPDDQKQKLEESLSQIKCNGMLFGVKKAKKIVNCDFSADGVGPDILSQIQGVSIEMAKTILRAFSLDLIATGRIDETDIASITHNTRKIGLKIANRIFKIFDE